MKFLCPTKKTKIILTADFEFPIHRIYQFNQHVGIKYYWLNTKYNNDDTLMLIVGTELKVTACQINTSSATVRLQILTGEYAKIELRLTQSELVSLEFDYIGRP